MTRKKFLSLTVIAIVVLIVLFVSLSNGGNGFENIKVVKGDIEQEVVATGKAKAFTEVNLAFERSGRISLTQVDIGSEVKVGELLVRQDQSELLSELSRARANLREAEVKLEEVRRTSAGAFSDARLNLIAKIRDAYVKADDAVRNKLDQFFKNPRQSGTYLEFKFVDGNTTYTFPVEQSLQSSITDKRVAIETKLSRWSINLNNLDSANEFSPFITESKNVLTEAGVLLDQTAWAVNLLIATEHQYESTINGYKTTISSARDLVSAAVANLISAEEKHNSSPRKLSAGEFDSVLLQEAKISQFRAEVENIEAQLSKTELRSPIDGVVTRQGAETGEIATAGTPLVSVSSAGNMEIEANVSEVNIGKIKTSNKVEIIFDAYPGRKYSGEVYYIEPAETIVDGVVNFKVKIKLLEAAEELKSGLTASLRINTETRLDVIKIPQYATYEREGKSYVQRLKNGLSEEIEVTLGIFGNDGTVEVLSGLSEEDTIKFERI